MKIIQTKKSVETMRNVLFTLAIALCSFLSLNAQEHLHHECGTVVDARSEMYFERSAPAWERFLETYDPAFENRSATYIPVQAHIIRTSSGTGGLSTDELDLAIADANSFYINANIQFFLCGEVNYIDNSTYYNLDKTEETALRAGDYVNNVLNIYFANTVTSGSSSLCGYGKFPWLDGDLVVMKNSCVDNGSTFVHELGHYFSLLHTHEPFYGNELVDGSNCSTAGDQLCDTPADPRLSNSIVNTSCVYTGTATDANGDTYVPDPHNLMSYSRKSCRDHFSEDQYARIAFSAQNDRDNLTCASEYCESKGNNAANNYIESITMGSINNVSGLNNGYGNFRDVSTVLSQGAVQPFKLEAAITGSSYNAYWRIWIDYNQDEDFNDAGELVYARSQSIGSVSGSPIEGSFTVPSSVSEGYTKMRVSMKVGSYPTACETYGYGETEDYTVYLNDDYCSTKANSTTYEWIQTVVFNSISNDSGNDGGYGNYNHLLTNVEKGNSYSLSLKPGFRSTSYAEHWKVWIDFNQDGDFNDSGEEVYTTTSATSSDITTTVAIPAGAATGCTRMRVAMRYGSSPGNCGNFSYGEVEDYTLFISEDYCTNSGGNSTYEFIDRVIFKTVDNGPITASIIDHTSGNNSGYGDFTNVVIPVQIGLAYPFVAVPGYSGAAYNERWKAWIDYNQDGDFGDSEELILDENGGTASVGGVIHFPADALEGCTRMRIAMSYYSSFNECGSFAYGEVEDYTIRVLPMSVGSEDQTNEGNTNLEMPTPNVYKGAVANRDETMEILSISPNPTNASAVISLALEQASTIELKVYSATGQLVQQQTLKAEGLLQHTIDCQNWAEGLYLIQLSDGDQNRSLKD
jgi:hypothetical protein